MDLVIVNGDGKWEFKCPHCNRSRVYSRKDVAITHFKKQDRCRKCACEGDRCYIFGKSPSNKTREKMSKSAKGKIPSLEERQKLSNSMKLICSTIHKRKEMSKAAEKAWRNPESKKKYYDSLEKTKWLKVRTDKGQLELLEKWNRLGFNFIPNYQVHTKDFLAYLDGYDKEKNVVLEYDSKYHNNLSQKGEDSIRQQKIIDILKPKNFWRYNSENKEIKNVLI
jgi:hypothetical protein